jgi:branched-chain amino acid transport system substrate-binding protein
VKKIMIMAATVVATSSLVLTGCASGGSSGDSAQGDKIVIGTSIPLTGAFQAFGESLQMGYDEAVNEVNAAGGIEIDGQMHPIELIVQDNASDGDKASEQAKSLILDDGAVALLNAATPPLNIPISNVADQLKVPVVGSICPIQAWLSGTDTGYEYAWNAFIDEPQMVNTMFQTNDLVSTNKKVAILTNSDEDGIVQTALYKELAPQYGYEIVSEALTAPGTTNYQSQISDAKASGAEVMMTQVIPPDAIAMLKEMKTQGFDPQVLMINKSGGIGGFVDMTDGLAQGVIATNWFAEGAGFDREAEFIEKFADKTGGINSNLGTVVNGYSIAMVLFDAIKAAGSTNGDDINAAIAKTDADYPMGRIKFGENHGAPINVVQTQLDGKNMILVLGQDGMPANPVIAPVAGLQ